MAVVSAITLNEIKIAFEISSSIDFQLDYRKNNCKMIRKEKCWQKKERLFMSAVHLVRRKLSVLPTKNAEKRRILYSMSENCEKHR